MSNENLQQSPCPMSQNDCVKLLDTLFQSDQSPISLENAFKYFEANFKTQPLIIYTLIDYYFEHGLKQQKQESSPDYSYAENELFYTENPKTIIDLLLCVPDELANKIFDKLGDKLNHIQSGSSTNLSASVNANFMKLLDKSLYLLIIISYKKKSWINKLLQHNLLNTLIKIILRTNTTLNEVIAVQTSLLLVALMNVAPLHIFNHYLENFFNVFICLFKYLTNLENQNTCDTISFRSLKWSVRLYFYVCYGLYANQFLQFIRKKDQFSVNKDFISSILFYLRLHPALFREKNDLEKQLKILDDVSLEWRQYCLDPLCTNYNNCIQKLLKSSGANLQNNLYNFFMLNEQHFVIGGHDNVLATSLSPSCVISANRKGVNYEMETSSKRNSSISIQLAQSIPNTPTPLMNSAFQFPPIECFPFDQDKKLNQNFDVNLSKNLTSHFENADSTTTLNLDIKQCPLISNNQVLSSKKKSLSEPCLNIDFDETKCYLRHKQVKSEMKDKNIKDPSEYVHDFVRQKYFYVPQTTDSSTNTCDDDQIFSSKTNLSKVNSIESNDIVCAYLNSLNQYQPEQNLNQNLLVSKLKQEINHLVIQLIYERNLRNRYEEDSNRLHFIRTERDQLVAEKKYLERNLKELVDKYKNEVEDCLNVQNKSEIKSYKTELEDKNEFIDNLQKKFAETESKLNETVAECERLKAELKAKTLDYDKIFQKLENESNLKIKNEIDQNYTKSLRYTTDLLRKKLLIMSKSQQKMVELFNQELTELSNAYNCQFVSSIMNKELDFQLEGQIGKNLDLGQSGLILTPLYQFQQKTIEMQALEIDAQKLAYNKLLAEFNEHELKLDEYKQKLNLKTNEVDELKQTLQMEVVDMKAELLKSHHRIQTSLMNVNKRLEEEIAKLKCNLNEHKSKNQKLVTQIDIMQSNMNELKQLKLESIYQYEIVNKSENDDNDNKT